MIMKTMHDKRQVLRHKEQVQSKKKKTLANRFQFAE